MSDGLHGDGMAAKFKMVRDGHQNEDSEPVPAWGFEFDGIFIVNPNLSECSRFEVEPDYYGLTAAEADHLRNLNRSLWGLA